MLTGIRVVECGQGVAAAFAAKLFALLGAEVIKVEPPAGDVTRSRGPFRPGARDPEHSGMFIYLNAGKLSVTHDLTAAEDRRRLHRLLDRADILIHNELPVDRAEYGLESAALCAAHPHLIVTTVSPFGDSGPRAYWRGYELNAFHSSGMASLKLEPSTLLTMGLFPLLKPTGRVLKAFAQLSQSTCRASRHWGWNCQDIPALTSCGKIFRTVAS